MKVNGGQAIAERLQRHGVRTVFALGGASHSHLLLALADAGVAIVGARHESGCVGAADGYARISQRLGVALIVGEQGLPNAMNGIATAFHACSAVLVLVARLPDSWTEADAEIDGDQLAMVAPLVKWARRVPCAARLAEYLDSAAKHALSGRRGPVVLQIPADYLGAIVESAASLPTPRLAEPPGPASTAIASAAGLLAGAKRPLLIAGAGACYGGAGAALRELSERFAIPVAGNGLGRGLLAEDWQHSFNWPYAQIAACHADVVCVVGARLKQRLGFGLPPRFAADARFIQIDIVADEFSRNRRIDVPIAGNAGRSCEALLRALASLPGPAAARRDWLGEALQPRRRFLQDLASRPGAALHPLALGARVAASNDADAIVVGDGADIQTWMYGAIAVKRAPGFLDHYPMGAMGSALPLAVGAAAAARDIARENGSTARRVMMTTGDGAFGFYPAELHAAVMAALPLTIVIGNDGAWGTEYHGQMRALGRSVNTELTALDYELVARGFGATGHRATTTDELDQALQVAARDAGVQVINALIDREAGALLKREPLAQMIQFDDLAENVKEQRLEH
ncbi:MAG: thiamine pyrophosphate-binding protein [Steroidobacteraceae bacterium]